ncbi:MAG: type II secretion system F family protein [bacterium]|nr:type II secretion system F family protein [bacterium]
MNELFILTLSFGAAFFAVLSLAAITGVLRHPIDDRIDRLNRRGVSLGREESMTAASQYGVFATLGQRVAPKEEKQRDDVKRRLMYAGFYTETAYYIYWGVRILLMTFPPLLVIGIYLFLDKPMIQGVLPMAFVAGVGMFVPDVVLWWIKRKRHEAIFCALPDALDLLVVCIEAGLGLDAAMQKVSDEFHMSSPVLSREFQITCAMIRLGHEREIALRELGDRTGVSDLKSLTCVLIQADRFGSSLAQALRVHSDDMRTRRKQRAEEMAAKTTVKLIFPLVLFIFPAIFVVLGGPAAIKIMDTFMK